MLQSQRIEKIKRSLPAKERWPEVFGALGDENRFRIFKLLAAHDGLCVSDLAKILGVTIPAVSQQLKNLEASGLAVGKRCGQMMCYELRREDDLVRCIVKLL